MTFRGYGLLLLSSDADATGLAGRHIARHFALCSGRVLRHTPCRGLMTHLRYAIRLLRKSPLFMTTIVLTLVIGIGATTAIFSVVNAILLRPLPFAEPERLMQVAEKNDTLNLPAFGSSALNYLSWKSRRAPSTRSARFHSRPSR